MQPKLEETIYLDFIASSPSTGAAVDADASPPPSAEVFEDGTDTTVTALTVTKRTGKTGNYRVAVACTAANGFEAGKSYNVVASATVGGVPAKAVVASFVLRTRSIDDLSVYAGGAVPVSGTVTLAASQPSYAPAKAGDAMALTTDERTSTAAAVWAGAPAGTPLADLVAAIWAGAPAGTPLSDIAAAVAAAILADPTHLLVTDASGRVSLNLSQAGLAPRNLGAVADSALTVGDAMVAAISAAAGKEAVDDTDPANILYLVKTPSTGTTIRSFTLDSATDPTTRD